MKKVIVTTSWDDGHILDLKLAELLKKYKLRGTFYVSPRNREFKAEELLSDEQIKQLGCDFEIGGHTMTHPLLGSVSLEKSKTEIENSKQYLEQLLGKPVLSFCYPSGDYNRFHMDQVRNAGFKLARTVKRYSLNIGDNPYELLTTLHAYNHFSDAWKIALFANFNPLKFIAYYRNWNLLAKAMFDRALKKGGVFHLWGHSWEIEKNNHWQALEDVLRHISNNEGVQYIINADLL